MAPLAAAGRTNVTDLRYTHAVTEAVPRGGVSWVPVGGCPENSRLAAGGTLQKVEEIRTTSVSTAQGWEVQSVYLLADEGKQIV